MIYSFLIAPQARKLSELSPSHTVICHASSLKQARASFAGLPVAMTSRKPEQGGASQ